jgi:hypothetical protein
MADASADSSISSAAVVILGFAYRTSEALRLRMEAGLAEYFALASSGPAFLLLTGGDTTRCGQTEAAFMGDVAVRAGVPAERILHEDKARYTIENALFVRRMLLSCVPPVDAVSVCTNAFHLARSELIFRSILEPMMSVRPLGASDGTRLREDTGRTLAEWRLAEERQLELLRSECARKHGPNAYKKPVRLRVRRARPTPRMCAGAALILATFLLSASALTTTWRSPQSMATWVR